MTRTLVVGLLATMMLTLVPLAMAEDNASTAEPAPHSDCPPDVEGCSGDKAAGGPKPVEGGDDAATYGNDCPPDMYCINSGSADDGKVSKDNETGTCMDGQQGNESCRDDVMYFGGGPADSGPVDAPAAGEHQPGDEDVRATSAGAPVKTVPALAGAGVAVAAALAVALVGRRAK